MSRRATQKNPTTPNQPDSRHRATGAGERTADRAPRRPPSRPRTTGSGERTADSGARADAHLQLADRLHSVAIHLLRRVRREDERTGLGPARLSALSVVVFGGPLRISALAQAEQVRLPTMTPIVAALERDGLIARQPDPSDARAILLRATPKGARLMAEGRLRRIGAVADALQPASARDQATIAAALDLLEGLVGPPSPWPRSGPSFTKTAVRS
jgi:DNA-binding MarR family transcriptional regulator